MTQNWIGVLMPRRYVRWAGAFAVMACLVPWVLACASASGGAIDIDQVKDEQIATPPREYVVGVGDMLNIQVYNDPQSSGKMRVRSDGRISMPLVNDILAAGKTPAQLKGDIETALKSVILNPQATVSVEDSTPSISVLGEVAKPGPQMLQHDTGVADALAAAGGLTAFAHKDRIFVIRSVPQPTRIHFTYDALTKGIGRAPLFRLRAGDVLVVE
jgi:polysaccharide export outer membrane protein